jgi:predicted transcriptional regulator
MYEKRAMGRKKLWTARLTLPLTDEVVGRMDAALAEGEARLDLIREAIERELKRRERKAAS